MLLQKLFSLHQERKYSMQQNWASTENGLRNTKRSESSGTWRTLSSKVAITHLAVKLRCRVRSLKIQIRAKTMEMNARKGTFSRVKRFGPTLHITDNELPYKWFICCVSWVVCVWCPVPDPLITGKISTKAQYTNTLDLCYSSPPTSRRQVWRLLTPQGIRRTALSREK